MSKCHNMLQPSILAQAIEKPSYNSRLTMTIRTRIADTYVATITKSKRKGKILIDVFRNNYTATGIASYSLRARAGAPVAVPLEWRELATLKSADEFDMNAVLKRMHWLRLQKAPPKAVAAEAGCRKD